MATVAIEGHSREGLVERLFNAFSKQLADIEARIAAQGGDGVVEDGRVLSGLAKTLETLVSVERKLIQGDETAEPLDMEVLRTELAERLVTLRAGPQKEDDPSNEPNDC